MASTYGWKKQGFAMVSRQLKADRVIKESFGVWF
jgi:hypothetical protein